MPRTPVRVTQADIARVLRAVAQSGLRMRVEIGTDGTIRLEPAETAQPKRFDTKLPVDL
jgi:hypothetical protein